MEDVVADMTRYNAVVAGWVVFLLEAPPPAQEPAFIEWLQRAKAPLTKIQGRSLGAYDAYLGTQAVTLTTSGQPLSEKQAQAGGIPPVMAGKGYLALQCGPDRSDVSRIRARDPGFDPWAANGMLRNVSKLARFFGERSRYLQLPEAGVMRLSADFVARLGTLDDPKARPFRAWTSLWMDEKRGVFRSSGMALQGLPDVEVKAAARDPRSIERAREAVLVACANMVHDNRALAPDEEFRVPVDQPVEALRPVLLEGESAAYAAERELSEAGRVRLRRVDSTAGWATAPLGASARATPWAYEELYHAAMQAHLGATDFKHVKNAQSRCGLDRYHAPEGVLVLSTCGLGRSVQGDGEKRPPYVELTLPAELVDDHVVHVLGRMAYAAEAFQAKGSGVRHGFSVPFPVPEIGADGLTLWDVGTVVLREGAPPVLLLEIVPAAETDLQTEDFWERLDRMTPLERARRWRKR